MAEEVQRRDFLAALGVTVGAAALGVAGSDATVEAAETKEPPKGKIPDKPIKPTLSRCGSRKNYIPSPEHLIDSSRGIGGACGSSQR